MSRFFKNNAGFTLVEIIVSISIVFIIFSIIIFKQSEYADAASLNNLADEISLTISQAQIYGVGVRELTPGSADFNAAYGLTMSLLSGGSNAAYLFFADRNGNDYYDGSWSCSIGGASECLEKVPILRGNYIYDFCAILANDSLQCDTVERVDISFLRPNTEAVIVFFNSGGSLFDPGNAKGAKIVLKSASGLTKSVVVYKSGHISVQ